MSPFKWLSLVVAVASFALVAGMMSLVLGPTWIAAGGSRSDALLAGLLVGLLPGTMVWLLGGAYGSELRRAIAFADAMAHGQMPAQRLCGFGLHRILEPLRRVQESAEARVATAEARSRELEKHIADREGDSFAGVSHELRTPLSSIKGCLEMLIDGEAADLTTRNDFYNIILMETNRLSHLADSMLSVNRAESGMVRTGRRIDLGTLVNEVVDSVRPEARARQIALTCAAPPGTMVCVDVSMMQQVVYNLLSNALKYTHPGGRIGIELMADIAARRVSVSVTDTGVGIPPEALGQVFDKFFRVPDHTRLAKGTGLGLNLVRHAVETVHGGTIDVNSEVGQGSTFTFTLAMAEEKAGDAPVGMAEVWRATES